MVVVSDRVCGDVLLHAVLTRFVGVAPAASSVGERRVLPGGDRRGGFVGLNCKRGSICVWLDDSGRLPLVSRILSMPFMRQKFLLPSHCRLRDPASLP